MILDRIEKLKNYVALHPGIRRLVDWLAINDLDMFQPGRYEIDGPSLYLTIDQVPGRGKEGARLEAHRKHFDIQLALEGEDVIGWKGRSECALLVSPYDDERDVEFLGEEPESWLSLPPGTFAVFFPSDAHAPLAGEGSVKKAVFKVQLLK